MTKQSSGQECICLRKITFPDGEVKFICQCGAIWEIDARGFWFTNLTRPSAPNLVGSHVRGVAAVEQHRDYPKKARKKGRKVGQ